jgi:hypothetical protein
MYVEKIGISAGVVWKSLEDGKEHNVKDLKKATKLTTNDLAYAIGWLAREGKVKINEAEKEVFVKLA